LVLPENIRMLNLLRDLGLPEQIRYEDQVQHVEIELAGSSSRSSRRAMAQFAGNRLQRLCMPH
jgi:hypothetical protein